MWAIELSKFGIEFKPRTLIKGKALANFIAELTTIPELPVGQRVDWKKFMDESSNSGEIWSRDHNDQGRLWRIGMLTMLRTFGYQQ